MGKPNLSRKAKVVIKEIEALGGASISKDHVDFVSLYMDVLLKSLSKMELRKVFMYLEKTYGIDLYGTNDKARRARLDARVARIQRLIDKLHLDIDDLWDCFNNGEFGVDPIQFKRRYIRPIDQRLGSRQDQLQKVLQKRLSR